MSMTFVLVLFSWVLFRSASFGDGMQFFSAMFGLSGARGGSVLLAGEIYTRGYFTMMGLCAFLAFQPVQAFDWVRRITWSRSVLLILLFCFSLVAMFAQSFNPFLYFQF